MSYRQWADLVLLSVDGDSERLTGALLDRLTHHVHILEMNGDSFRLKQGRRKRDPARHLNTRESTVEKLENGAKRPSGMALKLLSIVDKHGLKMLA